MLTGRRRLVAVAASVVTLGVVAKASHTHFAFKRAIATGNRDVLREVATKSPFFFAWMPLADVEDAMVVAARDGDGLLAVQLANNKGLKKPCYRAVRIAIENKRPAYIIQRALAGHTLGFTPATPEDEFEYRRMWEVAARFGRFHELVEFMPTREVTANCECEDCDGCTKSERVRPSREWVEERLRDAGAAMLPEFVVHLRKEYAAELKHNCSCGKPCG